MRFHNLPSDISPLTGSNHDSGRRRRDRAKKSEKNKLTVMAEKSKRGFASMDTEKQRAIASKGGKAAHEKGTAHEFDSKEAREAGRAAHKKGTAHKFDSEQAREAGRKGGKAAHERGTAHEFDSAEARVAGRKGGEASRNGKN